MATKLFHLLQNSLFWIPGVPALHASSWDSFRRASGEFLSSFGFSLLPLIAIYCAELLRTTPTNYSLTSINHYVEAGQIFFYVGPIIGGIFYLLLTDVKKNLGNIKETGVQERLWFLLYLVLCPTASALILILHHTRTVNNTKALISSSIAIYLISLYFNFINTLYVNLRNDYPKADRNAINSVVNGLAGFDGEL